MPWIHLIPLDGDRHIIKTNLTWTDLLIIAIYRVRNMVHSIICLAKNRVFCEVSFMLCLADDHSDDDDDTHNKGPKL